MKDNDENYIKICFRLAKRGIGFVSPNPLVGSIIVKNNIIIGKGYHKKYGAPHAEINAIKNSTESVNGATLYCNLEPCCHIKKKTPPCVPFIIENNIKRVVISNLDSNPIVNGNGIRELKEAGIEVKTGVLYEEGALLNQFYFNVVKTGLPFINVKIAQSLDGKISSVKNRRTNISSSESQKFVHRLRSEYDALLVGSNTVIVDNPLLTVRNVRGRNPIRIIIDRTLKIPLNKNVCNLSDKGNTWIITSTKTSVKKIKKFKDKGIQVLCLSENKNQEITLLSILRSLKSRGICSLLVEGGQSIFSQFVRNNYWNKITLIQSPLIFGRGVNTFHLSKSNSVKINTVSRIGEDVILEILPNS